MRKIAIAGGAFAALAFSAVLLYAALFAFAAEPQQAVAGQRSITPGEAFTGNGARAAEHDAEPQADAGIDALLGAIMGGPGKQDSADSEGEGADGQDAFGVARAADASRRVSGESLVVDGNPADERFVQCLLEGAGSYRQNAEFIDQKSTLPSGCEILALSCAMKAEGYDAGYSEIASLCVHGGKDVATDYIGSPETNGGGLPPCIVKAANAWIADHGVDARAYDMTGTSFSGLEQLSGQGYPIVVWTTEKLDEPQFVREVRQGWQWYVSEHCVVLGGVRGDDVRVVDSLQGVVRHDRETFAHVYDACGQKAMIVVPGAASFE